jgi:hypothetical protein
MGLCLINALTAEVDFGLREPYRFPEELEQERLAVVNER